MLSVGLPKIIYDSADDHINEGTFHQVQPYVFHRCDSGRQLRAMRRLLTAGALLWGKLQSVQRPASWISSTLFEARWWWILVIWPFLFDPWSRLTEKIKPARSAVTTQPDSQTTAVQGKKGMKCSAYRQVSLETAAYRETFSFFSLSLLPQSASLQPTSIRCFSSECLLCVPFLLFTPLIS